MNALENLNQAITDLTSEVDQAVVDRKTPHPTDEQVQSAAERIVTLAARLKDSRSAAPTPAAPPAPDAPAAS
jgi:hypothetical protein